MTAERAEEGVLDCAIIGSSPILMVEALYQSHRGRRVTLFDKEERPGGAWKASPAFDLSRAEMGCHFVERKGRNYGFLEQLLGVPWDRQPWHALPDASLFPAPWRRSASSLAPGRLVPKDLWDISRGLLRGNVRLMARASANLLANRPYRYPRGGSASMVDGLAGLLRENGVQLRLGTTVESVDVRAAPQASALRMGDREMRATSVVTGQQCNFALELEGRPAAVPRDIETVVCVLLRLNGRKRRRFGYVHLSHNGLLKRLQDVSAYSPRHLLGPGRLLISCHLRDSAKEPDPEAIVAEMIRLRLLEPGTELLDQKVEGFDAFRRSLDHDLRDCGVAYPRTLRILRTWDLGEGLAHYQSRWRRLLEASQGLQRQAS